MSETSCAANAILTEHFRYPPLALIDDIINAVNTIVYRGIEAIETGLLNIPPSTLGFATKNTAESSTAATDEIEHGVHQLETLLEATVDKAFDKFEIYTLRNILSIPADLIPWIRLKHYENLKYPPTVSPSEPAPPTPTQEIHSLRLQLAETRKLHSALRAQHARNAALIADLKALLSNPPPSSSSSSSSNNNNNNNSANADNNPPSLAFLNDPAAKSLATHAQFVTSQLPAMRKLVEELKPRVEKVRREGDRGVDWEGRREERRRYVEGVVGRVVGNGDGGEGAGGRRVGREEVEGLEGVVGGFGG